jgi:hypothetical protein
MNRSATRFTGFLASLSVIALLATGASAALRVPQVAVAGGSLQGYLNGVGESINVNTDQNAVQTWQTTVSNNSTFTLMIELAGNAASNNIGIYNGGAVAPPLYQVFPGAASAGWFATCSFRNAPVRVVVNLFDDNGAFQGQNTYLGADASNFGYYLDGPGGLFYTQDARNPGGTVQALTYAGTGNNSGQWWLCFEDLTESNGKDNDFEDAILFLESVNPTPVTRTTWGAVKKRFR